jgi:peptide/nickel transport system substrate-binding protein
VNTSSTERSAQQTATIAGVLLLAASAALAQPRDTLTIGLAQFPSTFHPSIETMAAKSYILGFVRRDITRYGHDWQLQCELCERLPSFENGDAVRETTPDGRQGVAVTYRLRAGARWGDGTPVTSEDVLFSWQAGRNPETGMGPAELYRALWRVTVHDARTFTLHTDKITFDYASTGDLRPLPAHLERAIWSADPRGYRSRTRYDTATTTAGLYNGPWTITAVQPGSTVTMERNPHWDGAAPHFRRIVVRAIENSPALEAALLSGQVDMIAGELGLQLEQALALERRVGNRFRFHYQPGLVYEHIDVNRDHPPLADRRVRQALMYATDRAQIVARLFDNRQPIAHTAVNPLDWTHTDQVQQYPFDPARANVLLEEAGWRRGPDGIRRNDAGERLVLELATTAGNRARELVQQVLQGQWRAAGIELRLVTQPPRVFFTETLSRRRFQLGLFAWISAPEHVPRTTVHSEEIPTEARNWSGQNYGGIRDAEWDALIEALPRELDRERRRALWHEHQRRYAEDLAALPLWFRSDAHVWPQWLEGVRPTGHLHYSTQWAEEWRAR